MYPVLEARFSHWPAEAKTSKQDLIQDTFELLGIFGSIANDISEAKRQKCHGKKTRDFSHGV